MPLSPRISRLRKRQRKKIGQARRSFSASDQAAAIFRRRLLRQLAKRSRERAGLAKPNIERDLGHGARRHCQERLRLLNASVRMIGVWWQPERLLEGAGKMERAQASEVGEGSERYRLGEVLVDVLCDDPSLPASEAATDWRLVLWRAPTQAHELVAQDGAQRLGIERVRSASSLGQRLELLHGLPQRGIVEEEPWRQGRLREHGLARVDTEEGGAQQGARDLPLIEAGPGGNESELPAEIAQPRTRQALEEGLAGDARSALIGDEQMEGRAKFVLERLVPRHLDVLGAETPPCHGLAPDDVSGTQARRLERGFERGGYGCARRRKDDHPVRGAACGGGFRNRDLGSAPLDFLSFGFVLDQGWGRVRFRPLACGHRSAARDMKHRHRAGPYRAI